jgi:predicted nucleic acid-binding protein
LEKSKRGEAKIYISSMSIFELAIITMAKKDEDRAIKLISEVRQLELEEVWPEENILFKAAEIKSKGNVSVIDSFIAALASTMNATLVDKDPEFEKLSPEINRIPLKYKERKR